MEAKFEKVIDPLMCSLLDILQHADRMSIEELRVELCREIDRAKKHFPEDREWQYCQYAIVAWVDSEVMACHQRWKENPLEARYFRTGNAFTDFFKRAEKAYQRGYFNAFEVFFICFMFGYHGVYQNGDRTMVPAGLPESDAEWQSQAARRLTSLAKKDSETWAESVNLKPERFQLTGFPSFVSSLVFLLGLSICLLIFIFARN